MANTDLTHNDAALEKHLYLEEVFSESALDKVRGWNKSSVERLKADPRFSDMEAQALAIVNAKEKIPYGRCRDGKVHNFWQDETHVRGIWRTTTLESYLTDEPQWETILDYDALSEAEGKNWVFKGSQRLHSNDNKCLLSLSDGGKDAVVYREFDVASRRFVEDGFMLDEAKSFTGWVDADTVLVGTDFGEGSMTDSGYPMIAKLWQRGTPLAEATELMRGEKNDVLLAASTLELSNERSEIIVTRMVTFYDSESYWLPRETLKPLKLPIPPKSRLNGVFKGQALLSLNESWRGFNNGDLVSFDFDAFMQSGEIAALNLVYSPDERSSMGSMGFTQSKLLLGIFENVVGKALIFGWDGKAWSAEPLAFPGTGSVHIGATNDKGEEAFIVTEDFLQPSTLWLYNTVTEEQQQAKSLPAWFDASNMVVEQFEVKSSDGELIPYFVVRDKNCKLDGKNPTLLYGYGGFEIAMTPGYAGIRGKLWLEQGGVYVVANIRGGGEFGPEWHQAGLKTKRQLIFDDFISVAEDLIAKGITSPKHLGIEGGSNGGLLVGVMFTQRPDLFGAVICAVPLLDMLRYHTLLAGASWMGEYGDPEDAVEGEFLRSISPYHNVKPDMEYPEIFFVTSTKDDRVHPGHARKMAARLEDLGYDFLYYENIDGGHSASANLKESATRQTLQYVYLLQKLKGEG